MNILLIEDDAEVAGFIRKGLSENNYTVTLATAGKDGLFLATAEKFNLIILDRMLPELDGLTILKSIRGAEIRTPVIILSALDDVDRRVEGLRAGGDDYLTKPFAFSELLARVEILGLRPKLDSGQGSILKACDLQMDLLAHKVSRAGQTIDLQGREFQLLEFMLRHKGQVVTRTMLLESVWDYHFDPQTNVIDVHISRLRGKVDKGFQIQLIRTVRGAGYIIEG